MNWQCNRAWLFIIFCMAIVFIVAGCSDPEKKDVVDGDIIVDGDSDTDSPWNPDDGDISDGDCSGYGYAGNCDPSVDGVDCDQDPCFFGDCRLEAGKGYCDCWEGYAGELCGECDEGYEAVGLECLPVDACRHYDCVHGTCYLQEGGDPACECEVGYEGDHCDTCADGYHIEDLQCVPD